MQNPKISVIVPIYNVAEYLEECLESLESQDLEEIEIILVDDGSTDNSAEIAKDFSEKNSRFRVFCKENSGAGATRNYGVRYARGEYISFVDSDDALPTYALKKMYETAKEEDADLVIGKVMRIRGNGYTTSRMFENVYSAYHPRTSLAENRMLHFDVIVCSKLIRRDFWEEQHFSYPENLSYCEDLPVAFKLIADAKRIVMLDEVVYLWRVRQGATASITQQKSVKMICDRLDALRLINQQIAQRNLSENVNKGKRIKNLQNDLNLLLNKAIEMDDCSLKESMSLISDYIREDNLEKYFKYVPIMHKLKFRLAMAGDIKGIRKLRDFQLNQKSQIKTIRIGGNCIGVFPRYILKRRVANMKSSIDAELLRHKILSVNINANDLTMDGYAYIRYLPIEDIKLVKMRAWLVDDKRHKIKELNLIQKKTKKVAIAEEKKNSNGISYKGTGYSIVITSDDISQLVVGEYRIALIWDSANQHREIIIGKMRPVDEEKIKGIGFPGASNITIDTTLNREPVFRVGEK